MVTKSLNVIFQSAVSVVSAELLKCSYGAATSWFNHKAATVCGAYQPGTTRLWIVYEI